MIRKLFLFSVLLTFSNAIYIAQTIVDKQKIHCYNEKIRFNIKERIYRDTVVSFRNYRNNNTDKRIICNNDIVDINIDKLIWECEYISIFLKYQKRHNHISIVSYNRIDKRHFIASFYLCDKNSKETNEMVRFKIEDYKIIGINVIPSLVGGFVPIDEFENPKDIIF